MNTGVLNIVGSIKEIPKSTDNTVVKDNSSSLREKTAGSKEFKEVFDKATKDKFNSSTEKTNLKEKAIVKEDGSYDNKESEEVKEDNSKDRYEHIISMLQGIINGEINLNPMQLEELSKEFSSDVIEVIKKSLGEAITEFMDADKLNQLKGNLKNDMLQILQSENIQGKSLEEILSKITQQVSEELENCKIFEGLSLSEDNKVQDLQAQIISALKEKLLNRNPEKNLNEIKDNLSEFYNGNTNLKTSLNSNQNSGSSTNEYLKDNSDEDKLLKGIASGNKKEGNSKFDKVMNFMNSFNKIETSTSGIENVQKIIVNKNNFVNDMIKSVKFMEMNNMKEMTVKIMPKELGEVVIKLTMENGLMKANITAQNKEAYSLLNSNLQELNDKLGGEIKIQNFTIDIYNGDTTFFSNEKNRQQNGQPTDKGKNSIISINDDDVQNIEHTKNIDNSNVNAFV